MDKLAFGPYANTEPPLYKEAGHKWSLHYAQLQPAPQVSSIGMSFISAISADDSGGASIVWTIDFPYRASISGL
jgi:hypothetical protein